MKLLLLIIAALALCDAKPKDGKCRGRGKHPNGKHGSGPKDDKGKRRDYLDSTLRPLEDKWDSEGEDGPSSAESTLLLYKCLDAAGTDNVQAAECKTEYHWVKECLHCEEHALEPCARGHIERRMSAALLHCIHLVSTSLSRVRAQG